MAFRKQDDGFGRAAWIRSDHRAWIRFFEAHRSMNIIRHYAVYRNDCDPVPGRAPWSLPNTNMAIAPSLAEAKRIGEKA